MAKTTLLKRGSRGAAVRDLQKLLARKDPSMRIDQIFGQHTEAAVKTAQLRLGLVVDGIAGPQTMKALRREAEPVKPGRAEPDKSAMEQLPPVGQPSSMRGEVPPNIDTLDLGHTARSIFEIIWHCTATPEGKDFTVADIRAWHKARGWSDIGYHFVIYRDGRVMVGRPIGQVGAHVANHNTGTIGISYVGGVSADGKTAMDTRTEAQIKSGLWLTRRLAAKFSTIRKVTGHNQYAAKACPSFDVLQDALSQLAP